MDNKEQASETLIRYLDGELSARELSSLEQSLRANAGLQQELDNLIFTREAIKGYGLKTRVASIHQEMMKELKTEASGEHRSKIRPLFRSRLNIAASLLILFISVTVYQYYRLSSSGLYNENYIPYNVSVARGDEKISSIENAYLNKQQDLVISEFEKLANPALKDQFLAGQVYLAKGELTPAIGTFISILKDHSTGNAFRDDAEYYLALSYLRNNEPEKAKPIFQKIHRDTNHLYHDEVSEWILLKLKILAFKSSE